MLTTLHKLRMTGLIIALFFSTVAHGQLVELAPIQNQKFKSHSQSLLNSRILQENTLPFWDDFSQGIDTLKWSLRGASYTETIGINAPSIGMILLDGVDANGNPYSLTQVDQGDTDYLTSKPFDLSTLTSANSESLFLSFFWQAAGRAELPDESDQLTLQILNSDGSWVTIWRQRGGVDLSRDVFTQEIVKILPIWQHAAFQFRFFAEGRQSGPFDSWLLDYIYLNDGRSANDLYYLDRSLTKTNELRIGEYGAYPFALLAKNQNKLWSKIQNEFYNLENRFRAMEYSIVISDSSTMSSTPINLNTPFNPVPNALERRVFESRSFEEISVPKYETTLEIISSITSGDRLLYEVDFLTKDTTFFSNVNYELNDTVRTSFPLLDFFAYDNGSADYAAGINQKSGQLAVKYNSPEEVYIKGISINFSNPKQANQAVDINVWKNLDEDPIFSREDLIAVKEAGQQFLYYSLDTNIRVDGEFYVGFTQFTDDFIHVGLDKVNDSSEMLYYNVVGSWTQNKEVKGALMIRPHISMTAPFEVSVVPDQSIRIYPNPVETLLNLEGKFSEARVFDSFGREIFLEHQLSSKGEIVNFIGQRPGVYVLNLTTETGIKSYRILVK
ncbi:putative secreted protein (Por secretion system target) [Algoriphagus ratkowskyi]|uniref:Putative secreted protein (Por secretion system target) n=1 Tax=Algoriphagus ratkowskyi TaxID=57028 RepID=A0A2W7QWZ2_9BACT|nr:T9SS type A sorting domain-containing protein [Algoriphagus ratkowskyi]PZX52451.1 putative secreted protein (Por secretion system target) [Algoriphagus ratkowskyi]TXD76202.1 T9SS type A sorting domain-containing protein [Algoriphagus ratkowskyi]